MDYKQQARRNAMIERQKKDQAIKEWYEKEGETIIKMRREKAKPTIDVNELPF